MKWIFTNSSLTLSPCPDMFLCLHPLSSFHLQLGAPGRSAAQLPGTSIECYSPPKLSPPFLVPHSLCGTCQEPPPHNCAHPFTGVQEIPKDHQATFSPVNSQMTFLCLNKSLMDVNGLNMKLRVSGNLERKNNNANEIFSFS